MRGSEMNGIALASLILVPLGLFVGWLMARGER